jgi:methylated-DNA-[protein]-cysteine S-methyltransferase
MQSPYPQNHYFDTFDSPIGTLYVILDASDHLSAISFEHPHIRAGQCPDELKRELTEYFEGTGRDFTWPVSVESGTDFEQKVWLALRDIPYGETRSYKWLARQIGSPKGSRAVGQALGKNPIPIVLPCHRIVESQGKLGGYTPGVDIKRRLLAIEYYNSLARTRG